MPEFIEGLRPDERIPLSVSLRLTAVQDRLQAGRLATARVKVRNGGPAGPCEVVVALFVNATQVRSVRLQLPPDGTAEVDLEWTVSDSARHWITAVADPEHLLPLASRPDAADTMTIAAGEPFTEAAEPPPSDTATAAEGAMDAVLEADSARVTVGQWRSIGPDLITEGLGAVGRLHHIVIDPGRPDIMYVASGGFSGSGVWKTRDGGGTWAPVTDRLGTPNVKALTMDPADPNRLFAVTSFGLIRTTDGGATWVPIADNTELGVGSGDEALQIDPADRERLYVTSAAGVLLSTDGGAHWGVALAAGRATDLVLDPTQGRIVAAISNSTNPATTGIYESADRGATWRRLTGCPGGRLPTVTAATTVRLTASHGTLYASYQTTTDWTLYRTTGVGCSIGGRPESVWGRGWHPTGSIGDDPIYKRLWKFIHADPSDPKYVYAGGTDLWMSTDSGDTFTRTTEPHPDHQGFAVHPTNSRKIFTVCDGGIYRSTARGTRGSWTFVGKGIRNTEFYDLTGAPTNPNRVIGGTQDNGTVRYDAPSTTWAWQRSGDGATVAIDPLDDAVLYSMGQYADSIERSGNGGADWTPISQGLPARRCFNLHFQVHPTDPKFVLASCTSLWRQRRPATTWTAILTPDSGIGAVHSAVDPVTDFYYAGTSNGGLYAGIGGAGFTKVVQNPTSLKVTDIEVDPDARATVFVTFEGTRTGRVMRVRRAGNPPFTYSAEDITGNLPTGLLAQSVAVDRMNAHTIYLGTQRGVFSGREGTAGAWVWTRYGNGLPDPDVRALHVHPITGVMRVGTLGRGAYEVNTGPPLGSVLATVGRISFLRAQRLGSGYGAGSDFLDVEGVLRLSTMPGYAFGLRLRTGTDESVAAAMFAQLRTAFRRDLPVRIEYSRTGLRSGLILRVTSP
ncbi:CARDB domain-containing protein [Streptomyces phaeochromogenes]|uniref:CARDB domain-containing protein n=1 Tax=Streptomyces phaeochromogenes TaxID=1923 RepID=UPI0033EF893E